jgi:Putative inner membrane protein (DUF1819)
MVEETRTLLDLWDEGMDSTALNTAALSSGRFPGISARRLHNLVTECFAPRYLVNDATPARLLKSVDRLLPSRESEQLMFLFTCRATPILADFVREVYWPAYAAGRNTLDNDEARVFVNRANQDGKTTTPWSDSTIRRAAGYLTGCCADFGLLERGTRRVRQILPYRLEPRVATILAYDLHFAGLGDNSLIAHADWALFGLDAADVLAELKRMALNGLVIVQTAGSVIRVGWHYKTIGEVIDAVAQGTL